MESEVAVVVAVVVVVVELVLAVDDDDSLEGWSCGREALSRFDLASTLYWSSSEMRLAGALVTNKECVSCKVRNNCKANKGTAWFILSETGLPLLRLHEASTTGKNPWPPPPRLMAIAADEIVS